MLLSTVHYGFLGHNLVTTDLEKVGGKRINSVLLLRGQGLHQGSFGLDWDRTRCWEGQDVGGSWRHWSQTGESAARVSWDAVDSAQWLGLITF